MRPGGEVITPMWVLWTASNLDDQSASYQRNESSSSCTGREFESFCNLRSRETRLGVLGQCRKDLLISCVFCRGVTSNRRKCHTKMRSNFLELWGVQSAIPASRRHALNATSPLFDQSEFLKYAANDPISKL